MGGTFLDVGISFRQCEVTVGNLLQDGDLELPEGGAADCQV